MNAATDATTTAVPLDQVIPAQRRAPATLPLPLPVIEPDAPRLARWRVAVAVLAGLVGGALMVAGAVLPW